MPTLDTEFWDDVSRFAPMRSFSAGQSVFSVGDPGQVIYLIRSGRIEVSLHSADGKKTGMNRMGPGEIFGEIAFLDNGPRTADAIAAEPTVLAVIDKPTFLSKLRTTEPFIETLIDTLCIHLRNATEVLETISSTNAEVRLAHCLNRISQKWGTEVTGDVSGRAIDVSQDELAAFSGLTRQCVNQTLSGWQSRGLVQTQRGRVIICDPRAINQLGEA